MRSRYKAGFWPCLFFLVDNVYDAMTVEGVRPALFACVLDLGSGKFVEMTAWTRRNCGPGARPCSLGDPAGGSTAGRPSRGRSPGWMRCARDSTPLVLPAWSSCARHLGMSSRGLSARTAVWGTRRTASSWLVRRTPQPRWVTLARPRSWRPRPSASAPVGWAGCSALTWRRPWFHSLRERGSSRSLLWGGPQEQNLWGRRSRRRLSGHGPGGLSKRPHLAPTLGQSGRGWLLRPPAWPPQLWTSNPGASPFVRVPSTLSTDGKKDPHGIPKRLDCGIAMLHFELGAWAAGMHGTWCPNPENPVAIFAPGNE